MALTFYSISISHSLSPALSIDFFFYFWHNFGNLFYGQWPYWRLQRPRLIEMGDNLPLIALCRWSFVLLTTLATRAILVGQLQFALAFFLVFLRPQMQFSQSILEGTPLTRIAIAILRCRCPQLNACLCQFIFQTFRWASISRSLTQSMAWLLGNLVYKSN